MALGPLHSSLTRWHPALGLTQWVRMQKIIAGSPSLSLERDPGRWLGVWGRGSPRVSSWLDIVQPKPWLSNTIGLKCHVWPNTHDGRRGSDRICRLMDWDKSERWSTGTSICARQKTTGIRGSHKSWARIMIEIGYACEVYAVTHEVSGAPKLCDGGGWEMGIAVHVSESVSSISKAIHSPQAVSPLGPLPNLVDPLDPWLCLTIGGRLE
ncbi:hypothetical protein F5888DRAFT_1635919 [Russula emetica]|nr:hypothetical protein F5888DRAFT_1635919 [Russula emetica]